MSTQVITKKTISALRICYFTLSVSVAVYLPRIPDLKDKLHLTVGEIGQILMLVGLVGFIASRLVTLVIKKLTSRRAVLFGVLSRVPKGIGSVNYFLTSAFIDVLKPAKST